MCQERWSSVTALLWLTAVRSRVTTIWRGRAGNRGRARNIGRARSRGRACSRGKASSGGRKSRRRGTTRPSRATAGQRRSGKIGDVHVIVRDSRTPKDIRGSDITRARSDRRASGRGMFWQREWRRSDVAWGKTRWAGRRRERSDQIA